MAKLSLRPTKKTEEAELESFIQAASSEPPKNEGVNEKPWNDPRVRDDLIKMVSLRLSEPYILKLQFLSEKTNLSQQEILRRVVIPYLESEVEKY